MIPVMSIVLAIGFPAFALWRNERKPISRPYLFSIASLVFCSTAIIMELFTIRRRALAGDLGGILDTIDAALMICIGLVVLTTIINLLLMGITSKE